MLNHDKKLNDEELKNVNGGMKVLVLKSPSKNWATLLKYFFPLKKRDTQGTP